jgi:exodeoxyribonuclease III
MNNQCIMKRFTRAVSFVGIILLLTISIGYAQQPLKVISYNIFEGMRKDSTEGKAVFSNWIKSQNPTIVALQECNNFTQKKLEVLARSYGHPYAVLLKEDGYPVALTSKFPIVAIDKVLDNMHHGFIVAKTNGINIIVLHLSPHKFWKRREEIDVILQTVKARQYMDGPWMLMGDFNSLSPLDSNLYADGKLIQRYQEAAKKYSFHENLVNGNAIDYTVQQKMLDAGFIDAAYTTSPQDYSSRIDYIYISKELKSDLIKSDFIKDDFTADRSDHRPVYLELKAH